VSSWAGPSFKRACDDRAGIHQPGDGQHSDGCLRAQAPIRSRPRPVNTRWNPAAARSDGSEQRHHGQRNPGSEPTAAGPTHILTAEPDRGPRTPRSREHRSTAPDDAPPAGKTSNDARAEDGGSGGRSPSGRGLGVAHPQIENRNAPRPRSPRTGGACAWT